MRRKRFTHREVARIVGASPETARAWEGDEDIELLIAVLQVLRTKGMSPRVRRGGDPERTDDIERLNEILGAVMAKSRGQRNKGRES